MLVALKWRCLSSQGCVSCRIGNSRRTRLPSTASPPTSTWWQHPQVCRLVVGGAQRGGGVPPPHNGAAFVAGQDPCKCFPRRSMHWSFHSSPCTPSWCKLPTACVATGVWRRWFRDAVAALTLLLRTWGPCSIVTLENEEYGSFINSYHDWRHPQRDGKTPDGAGGDKPIANVRAMGRRAPSHSTVCSRHGSCCCHYTGACVHASPGFLRYIHGDVCVDGVGGGRVERYGGRVGVSAWAVPAHL